MQICINKKRKLDVFSTCGFKYNFNKWPHWGKIILTYVNILFCFSCVLQSDPIRGPPMRSGQKRMTQYSPLVPRTDTGTEMRTGEKPGKML